VLGLDLTVLKGYAEHRAVDIQEVGCLSEIHPPFGILALSRVTRNFVIGSQSDNPLFCPPVATARPQTIAGENARDHFIGTNARQNPHFDNRLRRVHAIKSKMLGVRSLGAMRNPKVAVTLSKVVRDGNRIKFHLRSADLPRAAGPFTVYAAIAENKLQSNIAGGENGGRALTHMVVARTLARMEVVKGGVSL
jgi:hypothetical protein